MLTSCALAQPQVCLRLVINRFSVHQLGIDISTPVMDRSDIGKDRRFQSMGAALVSRSRIVVDQVL